MISAARSLQYRLTEKPKLAYLRLTHEPCLQNNPLVSVIVPTHNRRELLIQRCLRSILSQTYKNLEIIIVAHGCTDGTNLAVAKLWVWDKRIKFISIPREQTYPLSVENHWKAGRVIPSNIGLANCSGEWIANLDDDDEWYPDAVERLLKFARGNNYEFVSACSVNQDGPIAPYDLDGVKVGGIGTWLYRSYLKSFRFNPNCWRKSFNSVCDTDLQDRFRKAGVRMGYLDKTVLRVLPRPGDSKVGLAAARENPSQYMDHLAFK